MKEKLICFCGGGSGGHLSPLYALYQKWKPEKNYRLRFIIPGNKFDINYCHQKKLPAFTLSGTRFYQGNPLIVLIKLLRAILEIQAFLKNKEVCAIVGTGGYGSAPVYLYAIWQNIPLFLIEPNKTAGKVNKWFSPFAKRIFTHFEQPEGLKKQFLIKIKPFGNPIADGIKTAETARTRLLVFGASLGAESINEFMEKLLQKKNGEIYFPIIWITGHKQFDRYRHWHNPPEVNVYPFYNNMTELYENSFLSLCRAGMNTVSEIHFFQLPAIFVPYPGHKDRQQYLNCEHLVKSGACLLLEDQKLKEESSLNFFTELLQNRTEIEKMRKKFPDYPRQNATANIINEIKACLSDLDKGGA
jgi:UDP-N-acetylglucosamine--N-acetylmuramyl-(pentapeptide) pyrophosphoryl-undecaprenol N-acetylglucosamine transferase